MQDGATESQPLLPAAGEQLRHSIAHAFQAGHSQYVVFALLEQILWNTIYAGKEIDILLDCKIVVEGELLRHITDPLAYLLRLVFERRVRPPKLCHP